MIIIYCVIKMHSQQEDNRENTMYVCICKGINERQVKAAVDAGAKKWSDVHAHHGCTPQCGGCGIEISQYIHKSKRENPVPAMIPAAMVGA